MQFLIAVRPGHPAAVPAAQRRRGRGRNAPSAAGATTCRNCSSSATAWTRAPTCSAVYENAFPEAYKEDFGAEAAVADIATLHPLPHDDGLGFTLYTPSSDDPADRRLKVFRTGRPVSLARALPIFTQMGIEVLDERPYELELVGREDVWIYDFGLRLPPGLRLRRGPRPQRRRGDRAAVARRARGGRLQRAGRARRPHLVADQRAAHLREVPAPGGHAVQPGLHRARAGRPPRDRVRARRVVREPLRSRARRGSRHHRRAGRRRSRTSWPRSAASTRTRSCGRCSR